MQTFFTADPAQTAARFRWHWGHARIAEHARRPFGSVEEMDAAMVERWNATVPRKSLRDFAVPGDTVWVLDDVSFRGGKGQFAGIFPRLQGTRHLLRGNHDDDEVLAQPAPPALRPAGRNAEGRFEGASVSDYKEIRLDGRRIVLCHYPLRSRANPADFAGNGLYRGSLHFYGHEHGNIADPARSAKPRSGLRGRSDLRGGNCCDVGVDCWGFQPATLAQCLSRLAVLAPWSPQAD